MTRTYRWVLDVLGVLVLTALAAASVYESWPVVRVLGTALLVVFIPGYALVIALFPRRASTDGSRADRGAMERLGGSVALSLAIVPLVALVANFTPYGIARTPILVGVTALTVACTLVGLGRRLRLDPDERYAPRLTLAGVLYTNLPDWRHGARTTAYNVVIVASLLVVLASTGFAVVHGSNTAGFTELSVQTDEQSVEEAAVLEADEPLGIAVENHEGESTAYTAVVVAERTTERSDGTVAVQAQERLTTQSFTLGHGERTTASFDPAPPADSDTVTVLLYEGDAPANPSRDSAYRIVTVERP